MSDQFVNTEDHHKNLSDKLYHTFETILPILQYNGNVFQNMPISRLPKVKKRFFVDFWRTFLKTFFFLPLYRVLATYF